LAPQLSFAVACDMTRVTVTFPDDLKAQLDAYLAQQKTPLSLSALVQVALCDYLKNEALRKRGYRPAKGSLNIIPVAGPDEQDVSINHDAYLATATET